MYRYSMIKQRPGPTAGAVAALERVARARNAGPCTSTVYRYTVSEGRRTVHTRRVPVHYVT